jgi:maspardin
MNEKAFERHYRNVPFELKDLLAQFRLNHPHNPVTIDGVQWRYISCGKGKRALFMIPGSWHVADIWFLNILTFQNEYHVVSPTYPGVATMDQLVKGIASIYESEGLLKADVVGHSFGGMIAQCLVRKYPEKVGNLILSNTDFPHAPKERKRKVRLSHLLPERLFLTMLKRSYVKLLEPLDLKEQQFWHAFFDELYSSRITKDDFMGFLKSAYDFHQNYSFSAGDLKDWPGSLLLLESENDQYFPESQREALKALYPQAHVHTFHNGGHTPSIARRDEFNAVVTTFLEAHTEGKGG